MCIRVYAVTGRNRFLCGALCILAAAQLGFGLYHTVMYSVLPCESPQQFFRSRVVSSRSLVQSLPEIDLDVYRVCIPPKFRPGEVTFTSISFVFGTLLPSDLRDNSTLGVLMYFMSRIHPRYGIVDLLTFMIILVTARGPRTGRFPGISTLLDAILRDATVYFLLIVASQLVLFFFVFLAPVCDPY